MYSLLAAVSTHFLLRGVAVDGQLEEIRALEEPAPSWLATVQSLRFGDVRKWIVCLSFSTVRHTASSPIACVGSCQITFGSRLPPVICFTTGLPRYLVNVRPSVLYARHCTVGFPAAV